MDKYGETNRANWDSRVPIHVESDEYGFDRYVENPDHLSSVVSFDQDKLPAVSGRKLIHLQCHIGTDTVSWARLGAEVTGIDFSEASMEAARHLSSESGTPGRFVVSDVYDSPSTIPEKFDIVYTGVGAICWLPDIREWAQVVSSFLKPGGVFYMREGHPIVWALDYERDDEEIVVRYPYFEQAEPSSWSEDSTYGGDGVIASPEVFVWNHGMADVLQALLDAGLRIDRVEEYDSLEWEAGPVKELGGDGRYQLREGRERLPVMWSVLATKPDM